MKILTITSHISSNALPCFQRNKTGFGYMVHDIITSLAKLAEVDVLVFYYRFKELKLDGAKYFGCSWWSIISNIFSCISPLVPLKLIKKYHISNGASLRLIYCWALTGYYRKLIKDNNYDIVHIHGLLYPNEIWTTLCDEMSQKYVVTCHGLISFSDSVIVEQGAKDYERHLLRKAANGNLPLTVISTGIKRIIEKTFHVSNIKTVVVILNSFHFDSSSNERINIREQYGLPQNSNIILYVGNICLRKNQGQIIRAFDYLPKQLSNSTYILFLGNNSDESYNIERLAKDSKYKDHFIACGIIEKEMVAEYYKQANGAALFSLSEGFGLSLAESMHFGIPSISFSDVDAFEDLYNKTSMIGVNGHDDKDVAKGLEELLSTKWDKSEIIKYSQKFESQTMAKKYLEFFSLISK